MKGIPDVNGDGKPELIIGAFNASVEGKKSAGTNYIIWGKSHFSNVVDLSRWEQQNWGVRFDGAKPNEETGLYLTGIVDISGDNRAELILSQRQSGKVHLVFSESFAGTKSPALQINLDHLAENDGITIQSEATQGVLSSRIADFNGDGLPDILITGSNNGKAYLLYNPDQSITDINAYINLDTGRIFSGTNNGMVAYSADMNGDGNVDILLGQNLFNPRDKPAKVYMLYGPHFNETNLENLNSKQGIIFSGDQYSGFSMQAADINADGNIDLVIGAFSNNKVYVLYGPNFTNTDLNQLRGNNGIILSGPSGTGVSVYAADMNNDNHSDVIIGTYGVNSKVFTLFGKTLSTSNVTSLDINNQQGMVFIDAWEPSSPAFSIVKAADFNSDGAMDLLIGGGNDPDGRQKNKGYIVFGPQFTERKLNRLGRKQGIIFTGSLGRTRSIAIGDVNGDGHTDLVFTTFLGANKAYLVYGPQFNMTDLDKMNAEQGVIFTAKPSCSYDDIDVADVNNDGKLDVIISTSGYPGRVHIVYNQAFTKRTAQVISPELTRSLRLTSTLSLFSSTNMGTGIQSTNPSLVLASNASSSVMLMSSSASLLLEIGLGTLGGIVIVALIVATFYLCRKKNQTVDVQLEQSEAELVSVNRGGQYASASHNQRLFANSVESEVVQASRRGQYASALHNQGLFANSVKDDASSNDRKCQAVDNQYDLMPTGPVENSLYGTGADKNDMNNAYGIVPDELDTGERVTTL